MHALLIDIVKEDQIEQKDIDYFINKLTELGFSFLAINFCVLDCEDASLAKLHNAINEISQNKSLKKIFNQISVLRIEEYCDFTNLVKGNNSASKKI
ncbi:hypothetical protein HMPREF1430_00230 [Helicobacter pylori GAM96Ai]|uniref:hypothetical protein n=1 Tax=Helicobacter pylori TaxID=210 RepID=UPI0002BB0440|nr:hypothetical protein [Helicobacter pylori]EMH44815.1 hypothetical protein HMPREF1430_00230 [Helicobacter pylori GAM96Ai]